MQLTTCLLAAGGGDWMKLVVPVVVLILWALNHLLTATRSKTPAPPTRKAQPRRAPEPVERGAKQPQRPGKGNSSGQSQLNNEIEQFLRRANQRRSEAAKRDAPAKPKPQAPPVVREPAVDVKPLGRGELSSVAASVEKHMANRGFSERADHLADDIVRADEQMEQHLQKSFNRRVGTLGTDAGTSGVATDTAPSAETELPAAARLAAVLADPQNVRQAFILSEILQRPESRW